MYCKRETVLRGREDVRGKYGNGFCFTSWSGRIAASWALIRLPWNEQDPGTNIFKALQTCIGRVETILLRQGAWGCWYLSIESA